MFDNHLPPPPLAGKRCYVPVVVDKQSNMKLLHLGMPQRMHDVAPGSMLKQQHSGGTVMHGRSHAQTHRAWQG